MADDIKKRILFVAPFPPPLHGSAVVSQQIRDSTLINSTFHCDYVNLSASRKLNEVGKPGFVKIWRMFSALCALMGKLLTRRYDICCLAVACHGTAFLKDAPFVLACKLFCRKIVIQQHNKGMSAYVDRWPYRWLLPMVYRGTTVILLSGRLYPDIERVVPKENVLVCPNGIRVGTDGTHERLENDVPRLLFLSNLLETKGVFVLLDALKILSDKGIPFECTFVGAESKEIDAGRFTKEVERRGLGRMVSYLGRKTGEAKEQEYAKSDLFIFPSYDECFGIVLLEAMSHRLPIVTTDEGGIPDLVEDGVNGLISERKNPESLARCIETLLAAPELRSKMGEEGYRILHEKFTEEVFLRRICDIFTNL